ncbi:L-threonine 3-dehydrogenase [Peribacillus muralis]|uniref:L-threonine 3-dehydrogenase n=1 Tax=Peribacillus muralis TaxID=264697 RepID=UPI00070E69EB|nr:L-threonine 3-dehydrogenase [Peribacillus muralis]
MSRGKMKAIVKHHRGYGAQMQVVDIPDIGVDEVLIRVNMASICGTDIHIYTWDKWSQGRVNPPYVFGHEFSGEVVEIGANVVNVSVGELVSAETHIVCGRCRQCLTGQFHVCKNTIIIGLDTQGCFAEYIALPAKNLWKNSSDMPHDVATIQEPMGNAVHTVLAGEVLGKTVAIIGCGPIGLMAVAVAKAAGADKVLALDINDYRLQLAKKMGATHLIHSIDQDPLEITKGLTNADGVDVVCEMSGNPAAIQQGFKMAANGGRISILSLPSQPVMLNITEDIVFKGLTIQGITGRKMFSTWQQVSSLLGSGKVDVKPMITHRFSLSEFEKGFDLMIKGQCGKVLLIP